MTGSRKHIARPFEVVPLIVALGVALVCTLALFAESFWMFELVTHFRLQLLAVQIPLLLALLWHRRWLVFAIIVPFTVLNAAAVAPYWPRTTAEMAAADAVQIMTVNLYHRNDEHARFVELADREQPDLLLLLEYTPAWAAALQSIEADYPYRIADPVTGPFGVALFSRLPLTSATVTDLLGVPAIDARIERRPGDPVRFIGVHLRPPTSAREAGQRNAQLDLLGELAATEPGPLIVAGDFNTSPYSPVLAAWLERSNLTDARLGRGFGMTWPVSLPVLGVPIDHVLVSEDFLVAAHYYGAAFGSDHYPVVTRLSLRGEK